MSAKKNKIVKQQGASWSSPIWEQMVVIVHDSDQERKKNAYKVHKKLTNFVPWIRDTGQMIEANNVSQKTVRYDFIYI